MIRIVDQHLSGRYAFLKIFLKDKRNGEKTQSLTLKLQIAPLATLSLL